MKKEERLRIFHTNLSKLIEKGEEGSFVVFNAGERVIQFAGDKKTGLVCDIPLAELSKEEEERLQALDEFSSGEHARDAATNELVSYQTVCNKEEIDKAVELTERIFTEVFKLTDAYEVSVEVNLERL